jgi:hypothetical protein
MYPNLGVVDETEDPLEEDLSSCQKPDEALERKVDDILEPTEDEETIGGREEIDERSAALAPVGTHDVNDKAFEVEKVMEPLMPSLSDPSEHKSHSIREVLDGLEEQIESLRKAALRLQKEKEELMCTLRCVGEPGVLDQLGEVEAEEINGEVLRLVARLGCLHVGVQQHREAGQQECVLQIESEIEKLVGLVEGEQFIEAEHLCRAYLGACGGDGVVAGDDRFEKMLLGCSVEDQKVIRKKLEGFLEQILVLKE